MLNGGTTGLLLEAVFALCTYIFSGKFPDQSKSQLARAHFLPEPADLNGVVVY
jgi:hypothetical protein